ncbi:MAG: hypothetical protein ACYS8W_14875 [Planctomycetota bacterium]
MAVQCARCGAQYDITLFQFGRKIRCRCGNELDARKPHGATSKPPPNLKIVDRKPERPEGEKP